MSDGGRPRWTIYVCQCDDWSDRYFLCAGCGPAKPVEVVPALELEQAREALREMTEAVKFLREYVPADVARRYMSEEEWQEAFGPAFGPGAVQVGDGGQQHE